MVAAALGERYGEGGYAAGRAFLEKIIQVPLRLPPANAAALLGLTYEGVDKAMQRTGIEVTSEQADVFGLQFRSGLMPRLATPRQARLYSNALLFSLPLVHGEVDLTDFMLVEGLRVFYPALHATIRDDASPWIDPPEPRAPDRQERIRGLVEASTPELTQEERQQLVRGLLRYLFPRSGALYGHEWERDWERDRRVCSRAYFQRYFAYGIPPNDISDRAIDQWLASAPDLDPDQVEHAMVRLLEGGPAAFTRKVRQREDTTTASQAAVLVPILARNGYRMPIERGLHVLGGTRAQAAILIAHLLRRIPAGDIRNRVAAQAIDTAFPLPFAVECLRWLTPDRDEVEDQAILPSAVFDDLSGRALLRIQRADNAIPLYRQFGAQAGYLYWLWQRLDAAGASAQLQANLARSGDEVEAFLDAYVGEAWGMEDGLPRRADLRRNSYDEIARLIDPAAIARMLRYRYGDELDHPAFHMDSSVPVSRRIAHQFMAIHQAASAE